MSSILLPLVVHLVSLSRSGVADAAGKFAVTNTIGYALAAGGPLILDPILTTGPHGARRYAVWPIVLQAFLVYSGTFWLGQSPVSTSTPWLLAAPLAVTSLNTMIALGVATPSRRGVSQARFLHATVLWVSGIWLVTTLVWIAVRIRYGEASLAAQAEAIAALVLSVIIVFFGGLGLLIWLTWYNRTIVTDRKELIQINTFCQLTCAATALFWILGPVTTIFFSPVIGGAAPRPF